MTVSTACATCRLRALIRHHSLSRQRRQWLSYTPPWRQDQQAGEYVDTLFEKFDRSLHESRRPSRKRHQPEQRSSDRQNAGNGPTVGRYSGRPQYDEQPTRPPSQQSARTDKPPRERYSESPQRSRQLLEDVAAPHQRPRIARARNEVYGESAVVIPYEEAENTVVPKRTRKYDTVSRGEVQKGDFSTSFLSKQTQRSLPWEMAEAAERFMHAKDDVVKWANLQDTVRHAGSVNRLQILGKDRYFNRALFHWTRIMTGAFAASASSNEAASSLQHLPSPAVLLRIRSATTDDASTIWPSVLWALAKHVAVTRVTESKNAEHAAERGIRELMSVWSLCMKVQPQKGREPTQLYSMELLLQPPSIDFSFLPDTMHFEESLQERGSYHSLAEILDYLVPPLTITSKQMDFDFPSAALVTLDLLRSWRGSVEPSYQAWIKMMESVVRSVAEKRVPRALAEAVATCENDQLKEYFSGVIDRTGLRAPPERSPSTEDNAPADEDVPDETISNEKSMLLQSLDPPPALTESSSEFDRFALQASKNLGRALERNKPAFAQRTWHNVQQNAAKYASISIPMYLYECLLITFIAMRDQQHVIQVWKAMVKDGHKPTVKTYSIVMQGCRYVDDAKTLEAFWSSMRKAGLHPDAHAWSMRIFSLLKSRQLDAGLRCLAEMSQEWIVAARQAHAKHLPAEAKQKKKETEQMPSAELVQRYSGNINGVPRPDEVVMNAAVSALAAVNDKEIPKVLSWARSFGIEPDLTTYNALLNVAMRHGQPDEALHILRRMESKGIQADGTTWTVLLTALFEGGFLDELEPAAQQERILSFISSLEAINAAHIDLKGYALIIDRLLKKHANIPAADAVLKHMSAKKIQPTPHIYTILMGAYFNPPSPPGTAQAPPDFQAVEALWNSIRTANSGYGTRLDAQFYDRVIEGYSTHHLAFGSTKPVSHFLQRMQNEGKKPSWKALTLAVRAFAEEGEWERARGVVGRARWEIDGSRALGQRFGQREFWARAVEMGLLEREEVPRLGGREGTVR